MNAAADDILTAGFRRRSQATDEALVNQLVNATADLCRVSPGDGMRRANERLAKARAAVESAIARSSAQATDAGGDGIAEAEALRACARIVDNFVAQGTIADPPMFDGVTLTAYVRAIADGIERRAHAGVPEGKE